MKGKLGFILLPFVFLLGVFFGSGSDSASK